MRYLWLVLAILLLLIGFAVGRLFKLQQPTAYIVMWVPFFLATYPFMKRWMPKAKFYYWLTVAVISSAVWWLLYLGFTRLGG
jgi:ABC-type iron transport system FetAB permease component